ncbi:MAG: DJ-1/PfpI family protein [Clostridia bacterium]|nr:DJ-1/PfpI family protein [Clostridia bacterium]
MLYLHLAEGFEEIEAVTVVDILRRARFDIQTVSLTGSLDVTGAHGITISADTIIEKADYDDCDMIILPGGMPGTVNLAQSEILMNRIREFAEGNKYVAAICAAPMVLAAAGILQGKKATIYPGMENKLEGAKVKKDTVVTDGRIITSKGPGTAMEFALVIVELLRGKPIASTLKKDLIF